MNTRYQRVGIILAGISLVMCSLWRPAPVAASSPGEGQWTPQDIPGPAKNVLLNGSGIVDLAVGLDGKTIYVADVLAGSYILKSTDAGQGFDVIKNNYGGGAPLAISVAPDDVNTLAVTDGASVWITKDAGATWTVLPAPPPGAVRDIAIAPARTGTLIGREYIIAISDPAAGAVAQGDVMIIGNTATWTSVAALTGARDYVSVAVSPNFAGDRSVVAVGSSAAGPVCQTINTATGAVIQTAAIPSPSTIDFDNTFVAGKSIISAGIALPSNFDPAAASGRRAYISIASVAPATDNDVYRIDDNSVKALGAVAGVPVSAVAYSGNIDTGTLFAALRNNNGNSAADIKYTSDMTATSPAWTTTLKGPSGAAASPAPVIAIASDFATSKRVFAGTTGVESAFSISNDAGVSFNGEALVNAGAANTIRGLRFTTDARTALMNTLDANNYISIWKSEVPFSTTSWSRIFTRVASPGGGCSLSINPSPVPPLTIFFVETTTVNGPIYVSSDGGVSFVKRNGPSGGSCKTFSIRDARTMYYVDSAANIYKSTNAGWTWGTGVATGVAGTGTQGYRIILPKANQLVIAGATVAISNDDAGTFTPLNNGLPNAVPNILPGMSPGTGFILATDTKYADNSIIYTTDTGLAGAYKIYRVKTDNTANTWENLGVTVAAPVAGRTVEMTVRSGVLYAMTMTNLVNSPGGALRTLYPTDLIGNQNWQALSAGLPVDLANLGAAPGIVLYASDAAGATVYAFNDYAAVTKPTLVSPEDNFANGVNPSGGNGYPVDLKWKPMGTGNGQVDRVDIEIVDKNNGFTGTATVAGVAVSPTNPFYTTAMALQPNKTYLWRVRAARLTSGQTVDSPWSEPRAINIQAGGNVAQSYAGPQIIGPVGETAVDVDPENVGIAWAPVSGAAEYQVIVATDAALTKTLAGTPAKVSIPAYQATGLNWSTTYFYAIKVTMPTESIQTVGTFTTRPRASATITTGGSGNEIRRSPIIVPHSTDTTPVYIWVVIAIGAVLTIAVIILIVRTRRVP